MRPVFWISQIIILIAQICAVMVLADPPPDTVATLSQIGVWTVGIAEVLLFAFFFVFADDNKDAGYFTIQTSTLSLMIGVGVALVASFAGSDLMLWLLAGTVSAIPIISLAVGLFRYGDLGSWY